ncbi:YdcF family protein [uncultured Photobacterium sp.]|uniref:YdcF family protein n=1 Tax=uncultured Photobacterium sp. TaxID=173973 RepID=UPI002620AE52|nr:YdcF family protein [uncultured Photobacterium sp.]
MMTQSLKNALNAYNSNNRNNYPLNGRKVTNLEAVEHYLCQAISLSPEHFGLPLTIANMQSFRGKISEALKGYQQSLLSATTSDEQCIALTYLTVWHHYNGDIKAADNYLSQFRQINTEQTNRVQHLLAHTCAILTKPLCYLSGRNSLKSTQQPNGKHAIIIMGYMLNNDGTMTNRLVQRLKVAQQLSQQFPASLIVVTGGVAKNGKTESQQMKLWLIENRLAAKRIIEEDQAINTIDNAIFTLGILEKMQVRSATIISGSNHVHRSQILFEILKTKRESTPITFNHCAVNDGLLTEAHPIGQIRLNCYIDALRAFGLPAFNCEPFVQV